MILSNDTAKLPQQLGTLLIIQLINILRKRAKGKNTLPPGHRIRPHNRVHSTQRLAHILRAPTRLLVQLHALRLGGSSFDEPIADKRRAQRLKELLVRRREAVVDLVPGGPERVAPGFGQLGQAQRGVVGGDGLELDVRVPLCGVVVPVARASLLVVLEYLLSGDAADGADFGVVDAEFGRVVEDRVDVQG